MFSVFYNFLFNTGMIIYLLLIFNFILVQLNIVMTIILFLSSL